MKTLCAVLFGVAVATGCSDDSGGGARIIDLREFSALFDKSVLYVGGIGIAPGKDTLVID